eukprot:Colp12_sorted_trinity150504_noHs@34862
MFMRRVAGASRVALARPKSTFVTKLDDSIARLPQREAVRYTEKNMKWTASDFNTHVKNHANAILEFGITSKDTIAVWLPEGAEKHVILTGAAKAGIKVFDIDVNVTDISEIREFLKVADPKVIYFHPQHEDKDYLLLLRQAIPEFYHYDDDFGQLFHSKHFRKLRYFIHTGFDLENGCLNFKSLMFPHPPVDAVEVEAAKGKDSDVLYQRISKGANGISVGEKVTADKLLDLPAFSFAKKIIDRQYFEFGGARQLPVL